MAYQDNAQTIQGPGPNPGDGYPLDVNVTARPDSTGSVLIVPPGPNIDIDVTGRHSLTAIVQTDGAWNGILQFALSFDGGATYPVQTTAYAFDQSFGTGIRDLTVCRFPGHAFLVTLDVASCDFVRIASSCAAGSATLDWRASDQGPPYSDVTRSAALSGDLNHYAVTRAILGWHQAVSQWVPPGVFLPALGAYLSSDNVGLVTDTRLWLLSDGGGTTQLSTPSTRQSAQANAAGPTALWTPPLGTRFRLQRYMVMVTGDASTAGGAVVTISLLDGAATMGQDHDVFCPAVAGVGGPSLYVSPWIDLGNGHVSAAPNTALNINLSAALATGNVRVFCTGTLEV